MSEVVRTRMSIAATRSVPWLALLIVAGAVVRLWGIDAPLQGDDYNTLREAETLGKNLNGLLYFTLLHFWAPLVRAEWWYRLPAVAIGLMAIPIAQRAGALLANRRVGLLAAALVALSPFSVNTSHLLRTYSLLLTASFLALAAALLLLDAPGDRRRWALLGGCMVLLPLTHVFGLLLMAAIAICLYALRGPWPARAWLRCALIGAVLASLFGALLYPPARVYGWGIIQSSIGSLRQVDFQTSRGVGLAQVAKIPVSLYVFALGTGVYPLIWWIVIPGLLVVGACALRGAASLRRQPARLALLGALLCLVPVVFLVFDAIVPPNTETAGPRHVTMAWPAFALLLAAGAASFRGRIAPALLALVMIVGLCFTWLGEWSYGGEAAGPNWPNVSRLAGLPVSTVLYDGRSYDPINWYFPSAPERINIWDQARRDDPGALDDDHLLVVTNDYQPQQRQIDDRLLRALADRYTWTDGHVEYPLFTYRFDRKADHSGAYALAAETGQIRQPLSIYGLEFQDLRLPIEVEIGHVPLTVVGAFALPSSDNRSELDLPLAGDPVASRIVLLTNVVGDENLEGGQPIAELTVEDDQGAKSTYPLRLGAETENWAGACTPDAACATVFQWHKRIALVGQQSYAQAWRDFQAGMHASIIALPRTTRVHSLSIRYVARSGHLYIWGLAAPD